MLRLIPIVVLPTDPPAVELLVWTQERYCGLGLYTWDPFAPPYQGFHGNSVVANAGRFHPVIESDLSHPDAPPRLVALPSRVPQPSRRPVGGGSPPRRRCSERC